LNFESANPTIVKSIRQRDLLNTWLRLYDREQRVQLLTVIDRDLFHRAAGRLSGGEVIEFS
jgi:hypothetical protein